MIDFEAQVSGTNTSKGFSESIKSSTYIHRTKVLRNKYGTGKWEPASAKSHSGPFDFTIRKSDLESAWLKIMKSSSEIKFDPVLDICHGAVCEYFKIVLGPVEILPWNKRWPHTLSLQHKQWPSPTGGQYYRWCRCEFPGPIFPKSHPYPTPGGPRWTQVDPGGPR